jgi:hypothetical protein
MTRTGVIYMLIAVVLLSSCTTSHLARSWKAPNTQQRNYNKIMVVGAMKSADTGLRRRMEIMFVNELKSVGYNAVSSLEEYGPKGLANLEQEATYIMLCNRGIDVVITIALIDKSKQDQAEHTTNRSYSELYYYNHIWNYKKIQADLTDTNTFVGPANRFFIESILFDLQTLQPVYVVKTKLLSPISINTIQEQYAKLVIKNLLYYKVLIRHPDRAKKSLKSF